MTSSAAAIATRMSHRYEARSNLPWMCRPANTCRISCKRSRKRFSTVTNLTTTRTTTVSVSSFILILFVIVVLISYTPSAVGVLFVSSFVVTTRTTIQNKERRIIMSPTPNRKSTCVIQHSCLQPKTTCQRRQQQSSWCLLSSSSENNDNQEPVELSSIEMEDRRQNMLRYQRVQELLAEDDKLWQQEQEQRALERQSELAKQREESQRLMTQLANNVGITLKNTPSSKPNSIRTSRSNNDIKQIDSTVPYPQPQQQGPNGTANKVNGSSNKRRVSKSNQEDNSSINGKINGDSSSSSSESMSETLEDQKRQEEKVERNKRNVEKLKTSLQEKKKNSNEGSEDSGGTFVGSAGGWSLEIFPGDFVVHRKYGIGKYERTVVVDKIVQVGTQDHYLQQRRREALVKKAKRDGWSAQKIEKLVNTFGTENDPDLISRPRATMLELSYADGLVHVPIDKAYRLSRYRASDAVIQPKLSRLRGDHTWRKAKERVAQSTTELAQDVLALYATRETLHRPPYDPRKESLIKQFGDSFPYDPTPDQIKCFEDIENDMVWRRRPMDRLVCGDVGFGKTEVAMRALYRCVANGRQAVLLAPTGVLASQHYKSLMERMGKFNITIGFLRGGMTQTKAGKALREQIKNGDIQCIVGTHALLSKSVPYHNLGLLVVDEEQRFGVKQKERLKVISSGVDVLTLSATPIPRTLQMSLSGIRDTSTIKSPPPMRKPIQSIIEPYSESLIFEGISRELERKGQVFYVVPRISMIEAAKANIQRLFPDVKVIVAHGRQAPGVAEANVEKFASGNKYQVLLATTVIENGVDIPSVNTIIVQHSQSYGMSTLYQLRGRVGRSNQQAYAYFLHDESSLTEQAVARLSAMAELHALGSGFDVATRDLEIRGAGSLLGTEQSGMAERVGFDLYMRMLQTSIQQLKVLDLPSVPRTNILLPLSTSDGKKKKGDGTNNIQTDVSTTTHFEIPSNYIEDDTERLKQESAARLAENTQQLVDLTNEWKTTYGPLPATLKKQMKTLHLHACTRTLGIDLVGVLHKEEEDGSSSSNNNDLILRSPGLRPRHWATVCNSMPNFKSPKGMDVIFPSRLNPFSDDDEEDIYIQGGLPLEERLRSLGQAKDKNGSTMSSIDRHQSTAAAVLKSISEEEDDEWSDFGGDSNNTNNDREDEMEALKDISSSYDVSKLTYELYEHSPRFVIPNFLEDYAKSSQRVDGLLRLLLPAVKIVSQKQEEDKERARVAMELRDRREALKEAKKKASKRLQFVGQQTATQSQEFYNGMIDDNTGPSLRPESDGNFNNISPL